MRTANSGHSETYHPVVLVELLRVFLAEERDTWLVKPQCRDAAGTVPDEQHGGALAPSHGVREALWYMPHALDDEQWGMDQNGSVVYM